MVKTIHRLRILGLILLGIGSMPNGWSQANTGKGSNKDTAVSPEDVESIGDVVIVGYGRQNRRNVVGSISTVTGKDIAELPTQSFEASLQGKAAGVQVTVGSGMAGSASLIRIRGAASISAAGDPLYVIDGIPITQDYFVNRSNGSNSGGGFNNNPLASINPEDIENVDILKDAAATSIYGSRGANGVILITTKRASKPGMKFDVSTRFGMGIPTKRPNMISGKDWLQLYEEAWYNDGNVGKPNLDRVGIRLNWDDVQNTNTDWVDELIGVGIKQNYNIGISYAKKKYAIKYIISQDNNGSYIKGNNYERLSHRINGDIRPLKGLTIQLSHSLSRGTNKRVDAAWAGGLGAAMSSMLNIYPLNPIYDSASKSYTSPLGLQTIRDLKNWRSVEIRTINNALISYEILPGLSINASGSIDYMDYAEHIYEPKELIQYYLQTYKQNGNAQWFPSWTRNYNYFVTGQWEKTITKDHKTTLMIGHEYQNSLSHSKFVENTDATGPIDEVAIPDTALVSRYNTPYNWAFLSFFGRLNYTFKNKFNVQLTSRWDGSSRFGKNNRYGYFPSAAFGYILSEEKFIKKYKFINFMKVRAGIGRSGNANFDNYARWGTVTPSSNLPLYNGQQQLAPARLENPNLRWETTTNFDAGLEMTFLRGRLSTEIIYYSKATSDVILNVSIPTHVGFGSFYDNVGSITNKGLELTLKTVNIRTKKFNWTSNLNIARNVNEITSIGVYSQDAVSGGTNDTRVVVGQPVGTNFLVRYAGVNKETGAPMYYDLNGNITDKWDPANRVTVGNILPDAFGNFGNTITYRRWELNANIYFNIGGSIYESSLKRQFSLMTDWNLDPRVMDRWQKPGDDTKIPKMTLQTANHGSTTPWINTDLWLQDGSYARLRSITLAYNLPTAMLTKWKLSNAKIMFVATNILTWTKFTGLDPEIARDFENATDRNMSGSITYLTPPQEKSYSISIYVSF